VARRLLREAIAQRRHQRVPAAQRLDARFFLVGEVERETLAQPVRGHFGEECLKSQLCAAEVHGEGAVEAVEVPLVLYEDRTREIVELVGGRQAFGRLDDPRRQ
jgi:hypothetical protein